jgi:cell division protein FtsN
MKTYLRLIVLFAVAVVVLLAVYLIRQATEPESAIIARERNKVYASRDRSRMEKDPLYAGELKDRLRFLDYRLAVTYNAENKPDKAIDVLKQLIKEEEATEKGIPRHSRSYADEARYYETLKESYDLKHDEANAEKASAFRNELMAKAGERKKLESKEEGKHVGSSTD